MHHIPFNRPCLTGKELDYMKEALERLHISGNGYFTRKCSALMERQFGIKTVLLTPSCTDALELAAILLDLHEGDEIILPSFAFVSTANAFVLHGATPIFSDIRPDTLNLDEKKLEDRITSRSRAIVALHYAGVPCAMDEIVSIARKHNLIVIEDAAQGVNARYKNKYLGSLGDLGAYSFHETKNYICGEGGALLINDERYAHRADIVREKGTNRTQFFRGEVDKYTWFDVGSSFVLSDLLAAFLYAQLEHLQDIQEKRRSIFQAYQEALSELADAGKIQLPLIPKDCEPNFHMFYVLFESEDMRNKVMEGLKQVDILAVFHYQPLHTSPMGKQFGYKKGDFRVTEDVSARLLRLPFYNTLTRSEIESITERIKTLLRLI